MEFLKNNINDKLIVELLVKLTVNFPKSQGIPSFPFCVNTRPVVPHEIKSKYPTAKIFVICKEWVSSIYVNNPNVDKLIIIPKERTLGIFNTLRMGLSLIKEDIEDSKENTTRFVILSHEQQRKHKVSHPVMHGGTASR